MREKANDGKLVLAMTCNSDNDTSTLFNVACAKSEEGKQNPYVNDTKFTCN